MESNTPRNLHNQIDLRAVLPATPAHNYVCLEYCISFILRESPLCHRGVEQGNQFVVG